MKLFKRTITQWKYRESPYDILECTPTSTPKVVKTQFYKLSQSLHPDKTINLNKAERKWKTEQFIKLQTAYDILRDPMNKKVYLEGKMHSSTHSDRKYQYQPHRHSYQQPTDEKIVDDLQVWVFGFVFLGFFYFIMSKNYTNSQKREQLIAWSVYNAKMKEEGLEGVVGSSPIDIPEGKV
jgi:DnaJ-class molecular chaperone